MPRKNFAEGELGWDDGGWLHFVPRVSKDAARTVEIIIGDDEAVEVVRVLDPSAVREIRDTCDSLLEWMGVK